MRNREAARYARWAAMAAGVIVVVAAGIYVQRAIRATRERHQEPAAISAAVQRASAEFSYSKVEGDRTIFTIRASHATQFKDQNHVVLQDVWITVYGRTGDRNDNIHTRECGYDPRSGDVRCEGDVEIDVQPAKNASSQSAQESLHVKTRDLSFNRETGEASTTQPVDFTFSQGRGHATGVTYSTNDSIVRLKHDVAFELSSTAGTGGRPVSVAGSSLEIRRNDHVVVLDGPAIVKQGERELTAGTISVALDDNFHAHLATATGHPVLRATEGSASFTASADQFACSLNPAGWIERVVAEGNVRGTRESGGKATFAAENVELAMRPEQDLIQEMIAKGNVVVESSDAAGSRRLKTNALQAAFSAGSVKGHAESQHIVSAETLAPASIQTTSAADVTSLHAGKFIAQFGSAGRFEKLLGHSGVQISRQLRSASSQTISARELAATFGSDGQWSVLNETGNVRFEQGGRQATAASARIVRATDEIALDGSPVISDAQSRTTTGSVSIDQKSGEIHASGRIVSTYLAAAGGEPAMNLGSGAAHISADELSGSTTSGHVIYSGHARLWQGRSVLDADRIEVWRDDKKMQASGNVVAVFPQAPGGFATPSGPQTSPAENTTSEQTRNQVSGPRKSPNLWHIRAPVLTYWDVPGKAHLDGGVFASSGQGSLHSQSLDVYLSAVPASSAGASGQSPKESNKPGSRQVSRAVALGGVVVTQGDRRGTAEQAEYTAADAKFVLSGGKPTITDASRDTTTGHSLTFFVANDTILIDSQEGSRTLTKHRVEK